MTWIGQFVVVAAVFGVLDAIWLGRVGRPLYDARIGSLLAERPNMTAALAFYGLYVIGVVYFVVHPAVADGSWLRALLSGALFGLVAYATWNLTNLSVLKDFPASIVPIDMAWGTAATATTALVAYLVARAVPFLH